MSNKKYYYLARAFSLIIVLLLIYFYLYDYNYILIIITLAIVFIIFSFIVRDKTRFIFILILLLSSGIYAYEKYIEVQWKKNADLADAIRRGDVELVQNKVSEGFNVNDKDSTYGCSMIGVTFTFGRVGERLFISSYWNISEGERKYEILKILLNNGADPNVFDEVLQCTPLHCAAGESFITTGREYRIKMVELLISKGANVNALDLKGNTPLHTSVYKHYTNIVKLLIEKKVDINKKNHSCKTSLDLAIDSNYVEIVKILQSHGGKTSKELQQEKTVN